MAFSFSRCPGQPILKSSRSQPVTPDLLNRLPKQIPPTSQMTAVIHPSLGKPEVLPCLKSVLWKPLSGKTVLETALFQLWFQPVTKHIHVKWGTATAATASAPSPPPPPPPPPPLPAQPFFFLNLQTRIPTALRDFSERWSLSTVNHPMRSLRGPVDSFMAQVTFPTVPTTV